MIGFPTLVMGLIGLGVFGLGLSMGRKPETSGGGPVGPEVTHLGTAVTNGGEPVTSA